MPFSQSAYATVVDVRMTPGTSSGSQFAVLSAATTMHEGQYARYPHIHPKTKNADQDPCGILFGQLVRCICNDWKYLVPAAGLGYAV